LIISKIVSYRSTEASDYFRIWQDLDDDGTFDVGEITDVETGGARGYYSSVIVDSNKSIFCSYSHDTGDLKLYADVVVPTPLPTTSGEVTTFKKKDNGNCLIGDSKFNFWEIFGSIFILLVLVCERLERKRA